MLNSSSIASGRSSCTASDSYNDKSVRQQTVLGEQAHVHYNFGHYSSYHINKIQKMRIRFP